MESIVVSIVTAVGIFALLVFLKTETENCEE